MRTARSRIPKSALVPSPRYVYHPSFTDESTAKSLGTRIARDVLAAKEGGYLLDDATRECARRMHYAAYRWESSPTWRERDLWSQRYFELRDAVVLGNRKLIFRAVQKWKRVGYLADDLISECHVVLIHVVATYNPWLGIRFSTFAFTCLMRALSRLWGKLSNEQKRQSLFMDRLPDLDVAASDERTFAGRWEPLEEYFHRDHALLSEREKFVLQRRFGLCNPTARTTLESVGRDLGLSKERVRQLEKGALDKLRSALAGQAN